MIIHSIKEWLTSLLFYLFYLLFFFFILHKINYNRSTCVKKIQRKRKKLILFLKILNQNASLTSKKGIKDGGWAPLSPGQVGDVERAREWESVVRGRGMVGVTRIEACYWLWKNTLGSGAEREGRRGGRHPLIFEPRFPAGVMATVHRAFSPSVIPPLSCSSLAATQPSLFSSCRLITPSAACWGSSDSMTS